MPLMIRNSEFKNSRTYQTNLYKSVVGTRFGKRNDYLCFNSIFRTTKLSGGIYHSCPVAREAFFSDVKSV